MPSDTPSNITIGTTNVSLNGIKNAFIGTTTRLSHYYRGGTNIYNITRLSTIPTSGPISFGNFINTTNVIQQISSFYSDTISRTPITINTHFIYFNLPTDKIKIISINYVSFKANVFGTYSTVLSILNSLKPIINNTTIAGSLTLTDNNPNFTVRTTITNNYVYLLYETNNSVCMQSTSYSLIPTYSVGTVTINLTYIK